MTLDPCHLPAPDPTCAQVRIACRECRAATFLIDDGPDCIDPRVVVEAFRREHAGPRHQVAIEFH